MTNPALLPLVAQLVGGTPTTDRDSVVALGARAGSRGAVYCAATQIAEGWVLTAASCLDEAQVYADEGWLLAAFAGDDLLDGAVEGFVPWSSGAAPPEWPSEGAAADLALIQLLGPLTSERSPLASPGELVGRTATVVTYGATAAGAADAGVKRSATAIVTAQEDGVLTLALDEASLCEGDGGGAVFVEQDDGWALAAVALAGACEGPGTAVSVAGWADWIDETAGLTEPEPEPDTGASDSGDAPADDEPPHEADKPPQESAASDDAGGCQVAPLTGAGGLVVALLATAARRRQRLAP